MLKTSCCYQVDANDRVISIGAAWSAFARENGGENLLNNPPLGHSIWDAIQGLSTRNVYYIIMKQVRETGRTIHFPFRCDSPDSLRYMEMEVSLGKNYSIWFQTSFSRIVERASLTTVTGLPPQKEPLIQMCAWCNLVLVSSGWLSLENAIWMLGLFDAPEAPPISHGICPDCAQLLKGEVKILDPVSK